jgi:hypothetical protein
VNTVLRNTRRIADDEPRPIMQLEDTGLSKGRMNEMASGRMNANSKFGKNTNVSPASHTYPRPS